MMGRILLLSGITLAFIYGAYRFPLVQKSAQQVATAVTAHFEEKEIATPFTIGWVGDMVPSEDSTYNKTVFINVTEKLQVPTLMIGNLEGTFAQENRISKCTYIESRCFAFRGDVSFGTALKEAGFDVISLVNNHSYDFGDEGLLDTEQLLDELAIPYISQKKPTLEITVENMRIGILGVSSTPPQRTITDYTFITKTITSLKEKSDIVILIFHGGAEGSDKENVTGAYEYLGSENRGNVEKVAQTAIDAGADIVLGSGPHVLRKVEVYKEKPIIYSAGNFVGGNGKLQTKGILGVSSIFSIKKDGDTYFPTAVSVLLDKKGIPFVDPKETALSFLNGLK